MKRVGSLAEVETNRTVRNGQSGESKRRDVGRIALEAPLQPPRQAVEGFKHHSEHIVHLSIHDTADATVLEMFLKYM